MARLTKAQRSANAKKGWRNRGHARSAFHSHPTHPYSHLKSTKHRR